MAQNKDMQLELLEEVMKAAIKKASFETVIKALHNACVHGDVFDESDFGNCPDEADLVTIFNHFDALMDVAKREEL